MTASASRQYTVGSKSCIVCVPGSPVSFLMDINGIVHSLQPELWSQYHLNVVGVHAGKVAHRVAHIELNHADDTPSKTDNEISIHFQIGGS